MEKEYMINFPGLKILKFTFFPAFMHVYFLRLCAAWRVKNKLTFIVTVPKIASIL